MKNNSLLLIFSLLLLVGCKKDESITDAIRNSNLTITAPDSFSLEGALAVCTTSLDLSAEGYTYGFCYSVTPKPVIPGLATTTKSYAAGSFSTLLANTEYGKTYYIRAFVTNGAAVQYSNEVSFTMPDFISTALVKNITARTFEVDIRLMPMNTDSITAWGICFDTRTKPTADKLVSFAAAVDTGTLTIQVNDTLKAGTTYYLRALVISKGRPYYGNEVSFRTAGYRAGTGGWVIFDRGDSTAGWRYLEAARDTVTITNLWGCAGVLIAGISDVPGAGFENTDTIIAGCASDDIAAVFCRSLNLYNKTDWYLPAVTELNALYQLKLSGVINKTYPLLSSIQASANDCMAVDFMNGQPQQLSKASTAALVWPVRRFK